MSYFKSNSSAFGNAFTPFPQYVSKNSFNNFNQESPKNIPKGKVIHSIIGIGDPIVDISAEIEEKCIQQFGLEWGRTVMADEKNIGIFDVLERKAEVSYIPGGSVQNTMRVISWCMNLDEESKGKYRISMLGCVGGDIYMHKILGSLKSIGVVPLLEQIPKAQTSRCGVGIYQKERCLVTELRASKNLSEEFVSQNIDKILSHEAFLIEGYILQSKFNICKKLCEEFQKQKKLVVLTLSAVFMIQFHFEKMKEIADLSDIIVGNLEEIEEFSKCKGGSYVEMFEKVFQSLEPKDRILLVTAGKDGVFYSKYNYGNKHIECILQYFPEPVKDEEIVDFNGAGDSFLGGFLSKYLQGYDILECCKGGNKAAGAIIRCVGCTFPKSQKMKKL